MLPAGFPHKMAKVYDPGFMGLGDAAQDFALEGTEVAHFRIARKLGKGGMGTVYEGIDKTSNRRVAIKVLHRDIAQHRDVTLRFINEARALNVVRHQNLVQVIHLGKLEDATPYLVMEYLDGVSLTTRLREGRLSVHQALEICAQAASALIAAHEKGIVHRDIKPDNLMVTADSSGALIVKVFDFGIAKLPPEHMSAELTFLRTQSGQLLGTPYYMAPEQCKSEPQITEKVDVYALGTVLFCCLAGRTPFVSQAQGDAAMMHLCAQQIADAPPLLSEYLPSAAPELVALVDRLLAKNPDARPSMKELYEQLKQLQKKSDDQKVGVQRPSSEILTVVRKDSRTKVSDAAIRPPARLRARRLWPYVFTGLLIAWFVILALWALG
jgi:serine/threonine protein kinase